MKKIEKCLCCGSDDIKIKYPNLGDKNHFIDGKFDLFRCLNCDFEFINPLLDESELIKYYPNEDYYSYHKKMNLAIIYHKISAYYYSKKNFILNLILYPFNSLLYTYHIDRGKSLLEIGCGNGLQLEFYKKYGLQTQGLEPYGPELTQREINLGILRKSVSNARFSENQFDYIVLKESLEHIPTQELVLKKCYKWLRSGGKLIITVPNKKSLWNKIFKQYWYGYDIPRHLHNYSPKNISIFLKRLGFKINRIKIYDLSYMLDGSIKFKFANKKNKNKFIDSGLSKLFFMPFSLIVSYLKQGSLMEVEATK